MILLLFLLPMNGSYSTDFALIVTGGNSSEEILLC